MITFVTAANEHDTKLHEESMAFCLSVWGVAAEKSSVKQPVETVLPPTEFSPGHAPCMTFLRKYVNKKVAAYLVKPFEIKSKESNYYSVRKTPALKYVADYLAEIPPGFFGEDEFNDERNEFDDVYQKPTDLTSVMTPDIQGGHKIDYSLTADLQFDLATLSRSAELGNIVPKMFSDEGHDIKNKGICAKGTAAYFELVSGVENLHDELATVRDSDIFCTPQLRGGRIFPQDRGEYLLDLRKKLNAFTRRYLDTKAPELLQKFYGDQDYRFSSFRTRARGAFMNSRQIWAKMQLLEPLPCNVILPKPKMSARAEVNQRFQQAGFTPQYNFTIEPVNIHRVELTYDFLGAKHYDCAYGQTKQEAADKLANTILARFSLTRPDPLLYPRDSSFCGRVVELATLIATSFNDHTTGHVFGVTTATLIEIMRGMKVVKTCVGLQAVFLDPDDTEDIFSWNLLKEDQVLKAEAFYLFSQLDFKMPGISRFIYFACYPEVLHFLACKRFANQFLIPVGSLKDLLYVTAFRVDRMRYFLAQAEERDEGLEGHACDDYIHQYPFKEWEQTEDNEVAYFIDYDCDIAKFPGSQAVSLEFDSLRDALECKAEEVTSPRVYYNARSSVDLAKNVRSLSVTDLVLTVQFSPAVFDELIELCEEGCDVRLLKPASVYAFNMHFLVKKKFDSPVYEGPVVLIMDILAYFDDKLFVIAGLVENRLLNRGRRTFHTYLRC